MSFRSKIKPIGGDGVAVEATFPMMATSQVPKSRLKRLFERPFTLKNNSDGDPPLSRGITEEFEPSSVFLRKMVDNYIEDPEYEEKPQRYGGFNPCNCFYGGGTDSDDDESSGENLRNVRSLMCATSLHEKNLVRNAMKAVEKTNMSKLKEESQLKIVADELMTLGYDVAICKSRWKYSKPLSCPAGKYEYLDVLIGGERLLIDIDFKSKFEIARPTKTYKSILQALPYIFVGKMDRLLKIVSVVSAAAKESLKKRGLPVPPWRRAKYVLTKWLSPHVRAKQGQRETNANEDSGFEV